MIACPEAEMAFPACLEKEPESAPDQRYSAQPNNHLTRCKSHFASFCGSGQKEEPSGLSATKSILPAVAGKSPQVLPLGPVGD